MSEENNLIARQSVILLIALATPLVLLVGGLTACGTDEPAVGAPIDVAGILTEEGTDTCQALRTEDGTLYSLVGDLEVFGSGDLVRVSGNQAVSAVCDQGITVEVVDIEADRAGRSAQDQTASSMPPDQVYVEGRLSDDGGSCQGLRDFEGELYTLTGDLGSLSNMVAGDPVRILGRPVQDSECGTGTTLQLMELTRLTEEMVEEQTQPAASANDDASAEAAGTA